MLTVFHPTLRLTRVIGTSDPAPWRRGEVVVGATEEDAGFRKPHHACRHSAFVRGARAAGTRIPGRRALSIPGRVCAPSWPVGVR